MMLQRATFFSAIGATILLMVYNLFLCSVANGGAFVRTDFTTEVTSGIAVTVDRYLLTIKQRDSDDVVTFRLGDTIDVHVNGRDTSLDDVKAGMRVQIVHYHDGEIKSVRAVSTKTKKGP